MKYSFIINPAAGKGNIASGLVESITKSCRARELDFEIYFTTGVGDATDYVRRVGEARDGGMRFYACGGDGTLGETVSGVMSLSNRDGVSLGLFPIGTGNDFVRNFSARECFLDVEAQLDAGAITADVIRCNDRYSMNIVNVGFDCEVVCDTNKLKKSALIPSKLAYIAGLVKTLVRKPTVDMTVSIDGGEPQAHHFLLTTFANGSFYGGGFHSNPLASVTDGYLDCLQVQEITRRRFIALVSDYKKGTHMSPKFEKILKHFKAHTVDIAFENETNVSVDGEIVPMTHMCLSVVPEALRFLIPKGAALLGAEKAPKVAVV